jgi:hypothetical protein
MPGSSLQARSVFSGMAVERQLERRAPRAGAARRLHGEVDAFRPEHAGDDRHPGRVLRGQRQRREVLGIDPGAADDGDPNGIIRIEPEKTGVITVLEQKSGLGAL